MIFLKDERWKMRSARRFRCHAEGGGVLDRSLVGLRSRSAAPDNDWAAIRSEPRQRINAWTSTTYDKTIKDININISPSLLDLLHLHLNGNIEYVYISW
jgi:hypothetical protein